MTFLRLPLELVRGFTDRLLSDKKTKTVLKAVLRRTARASERKCPVFSDRMRSAAQEGPRSDPSSWSSSRFVLKEARRLHPSILTLVLLC